MVIAAAFAPPYTVAPVGTMGHAPSVATHLPSAYRLDRATLRKGVRLGDGSVRREAVLARADVAMVYPWGTEIATEEALSDPGYLDSLRGLALVARHPAAAVVDISRPDTYREVGVVTDARWDSAERAVVIEVVIRDAAANRAVESGQDGVSEGYTVTQLDSSVSPARQLGRQSNHVALTLDAPPRMPGARLRIDSEETPMDFAPLLAAFGLRVDSPDHLRQDLDALRAKADTATTRADAADATVSAYRDVLGEGDARQRLDALVQEGVAATVAVYRRADELGHKLDDGLTLAQARKALAVACGAEPARCDSAEYAQAVIDLARKPDANATFAASATTATTTRVDSAWGC